MANLCDNCNQDCQGCNTCQSDHSCLPCVVCQSCDVECNDVGCNTLQSFCATSGQNAGGFSFNEGVSADDFFFSKSTWNKIFDHINDAFNRGRYEDGGYSGLPSSDTNEFMTADMFNKVANALGNLGSSGPSLRVSVNGLIYGSYFETLESYANSLRYTPTQCDQCNVDCDVECNLCQICDGCEVCDEGCESCNVGCQGHVAEYSCCSCDVGCESQTESTD